MLELVRFDTKPNSVGPKKLNFRSDLSFRHVIASRIIVLSQERLILSAHFIRLDASAIRR